MKQMLVLLCVIAVSGCTTTRPRAPSSTPRPPASIADIRAQAYQAGMQAALTAYGEQYLDNDFPYYNWSPPLVQRVWVPASIQGGVFIPGHMEEVIIKPGAWKREFAAPLARRHSQADARPHTHDRPVGWAEQPASASRDARAASPSATGIPASSAVAIPWEPLPAPDEEWVSEK